MAEWFSKTVVARLGNVLEYLGLALTVGGILALGAFVAPALFRHFTVDEAGPVMTLIFRRYDTVLMISLVLILLGEGLRFLAEGLNTRITGWLRYGIVVLFTVITLVSLVAIHPRMEVLQKAGIQRGVGESGMAFDRLHRQSESLYKAQLLLGGILLMLLAASVPVCVGKQDT